MASSLLLSQISGFLLGFRCYAYTSCFLIYLYGLICWFSLSCRILSHFAPSSACFHVVSWYVHAYLQQLLAHRKYLYCRLVATTNCSLLILYTLFLGMSRFRFPCKILYAYVYSYINDILLLTNALSKLNTCTVTIQYILGVRYPFRGYTAKENQKTDGVEGFGCAINRVRSDRGHSIRLLTRDLE